MTLPGKTRQYRVEDFLKDLSSDDRLPGSGAAGAIALALGAACAAKAAAITLKHTPDNTLTESLEVLDEQIRRSVAGDLVAARVLTEAARAIHIENIKELTTRKE